MISFVEFGIFENVLFSHALSAPNCIKVAHVSQSLQGDHSVPDGSNEPLKL